MGTVNISCIHYYLIVSTDTVMGKLNASQVKAAEFFEKQFKLTDGDGMYLLVNKKGKYWRFDYRFNGKRKTLALGVYPKMVLKEARIKLLEARKTLAEGCDPGFIRKMNKITRSEAAENSFEKLSLEWLIKQEQFTKGHVRTIESRLKNDIIPWIGSRPVDGITAKEVLALCRKVEDRNAIETAHRVKTICSQVFRYCIGEGLIESDPCRDLKNALKSVKTKHMATITEPKKIGDLLRAIDGYEGHKTTKAALLLAPLVFVRPGELRHAEWSEIDFERTEWKIPSEKMKMRTAHIVPLSRQAMAILKDIHSHTSNGKYVFPSMRSTDRAMSENTVNAALRRLGYSKEELTGHGFRGMASTRLHEEGKPTHLIEIQLAHREKNSVKAAYNHAEYLQERRELMQFWADYLDELRNQE
jgi:integrase